MKIKRVGFESNSSSSHSLVIEPGSGVLDPISSLGCKEEHQFIISGNTSFGWEWEIWDCPADKVMYIAIDQPNFVDRLKRIIGDNIGFDPDAIYLSGVDGKDENDWNTYIDHQSIGTSWPITKLTDDEVWNFIMNPACCFRGGNDNSDGPWDPYPDMDD